MRKIRLVFFGIILVIFIFAIFYLNRLHLVPGTGVDPISELKITRISGSEYLYKDAAMTETVGIRQLMLPDEIDLRADSQTSFEFYYFDTAFAALPGSRISFNRSMKELVLREGELYWETIVTSAGGKQNVTLPFSSAAVLSRKGRIKIEGGNVRIWNYSGELTFETPEGLTPLGANQLAVYTPDASRNMVRVFDVLPPPEYISPESKKIALRKPGDAFVTLSWKSAARPANYRVKVYGSPLRESVFFNEELSSNRTVLDLLKFGTLDALYWEVVPVEKETNLEGVPSMMGCIKVLGVFIDKDLAASPPSMDIESISVSGNMVLIKGDAEQNANLFINGDEVRIDMDGKFFHTITFPKVGSYTITFRLVSAGNVETVITRPVNIFEE